MNGITAPWVAEVGLITWRTVRKDSRPPLPSELLATFIVFGTVSVIAVRQPRIASVFGWGIVIATGLNFFPSVVAPKGSKTSNPTSGTGAVENPFGPVPAPVASQLNPLQQAPNSPLGGR